MTYNFGAGIKHTEHGEQSALTKTCTKCGKTFAATLEFFHRQKLGKYGLKAECRSCTINRDKDFRARNPKKIYDAARAYGKAHPEWLKERKRAYYEKHRIEVIEKSRQYRRDNPDYWRIDKETQQKKDVVRRQREKDAEGTYTKAEIEAKYLEQCGCCYLCGKSLNGEYVPDHKTPLSRGGSNWIANIGLACGPCNLAKGAKTPEEYKEFIETLEGFSA